jgi:DNA transformation protein
MSGGAVGTRRSSRLRRRVLSQQQCLRVPRMEQVEIEEMFSALGRVAIRRMFGGKGIYHRGEIIAIEYHGEILLKADSLSGPAFEAAGASQWTYEGKGGKPINMPYRSIPDDAFDDPEMMAHWVKLAYEAALRSARAKRK